MTAAPIEFWFEFSSPYAYFAALQVDALAARHGRSVWWRPFLLGAVFRHTGMAPMTEQPLRGDYARRDWARIARELGVPFALPDPFPVNALAAARMVHAATARDPAKAAALARALFEALYAEGLPITEPAQAARIGARLGLDQADLIAAAEDPQWKAALRQATEEAVARGVCGSPFLIVDGEPFWGADRLPMAERWLATGGW